MFTRGSPEINTDGLPVHKGFDPPKQKEEKRKKERR